MVNLIMKILIGIMLLAAGVIDIKRQQISRLFIGVLLLACIVTAFTNSNPNLISALSGSLVGICAIGISLITREQIGRGDGLVITAIGLVLGFRGCLSVVCLSSMIMCAIAIIIILLKRGNRSTRLPFIPAIFAGYTIYMTSLIR